RDRGPGPRDRHGGQFIALEHREVRLRRRRLRARGREHAARCRGAVEPAIAQRQLQRGGRSRRRERGRREPDVPGTGPAAGRAGRGCGPGGRGGGRGGGEGALIPGGRVAVPAGIRLLAFSPPADLTAGKYQLVVNPSIIADRAGNHLAAPFVVAVEKGGPLTP